MEIFEKGSAVLFSSVWNWFEVESPPLRQFYGSSSSIKRGVERVRTKDEPTLVSCARALLFSEFKSLILQRYSHVRTQQMGHD